LKLYTGVINLDLSSPNQVCFTHVLDDNGRVSIIYDDITQVRLFCCGPYPGKLGGCLRGAAASPTGKPEDAAKAMMDAVFAGKDVAPMLCSAMQSQSDKITASFARLADTSATVDTTGLTYTASDVNGDQAKVTVGGNLKVTVSGVSKDVALPGIPLPMKNEIGWKVCQ
jgi:hypothetical protein